jgi:hypothetical protein
MDGLVQIEKGWHKRKMKESDDWFLAKKTEGGGWYYLKMPNGTRLRHTANVIEQVSDEVK